MTRMTDEELKACLNDFEWALNAGELSHVEYPDSISIITELLESRALLREAKVWHDKIQTEIDDINKQVVIQDEKLRVAEGALLKIGEHSIEPRPSSYSKIAALSCKALSILRATKKGGW